MAERLPDARGPNNPRVPQDPIVAMVSNNPVARLVSAIDARSSCDFGPFDAEREQMWDGRGIDASIVAQQIHRAVVGGFPFRLNGAHIRGCLAFLDSTTDIPVRLTSCWIDGGLDLDFATISDLSVEGSALGVNATWWGGWGLSGRFVTVSGKMCIASTHIAGGCRLYGATIKGSLEAERANIGSHAGQHPEVDGRWAIDLTNGTIIGDLVLKRGTLHGGITIAEATVTGQVNLAGANVSAPGGTGSWVHRSEYTAVCGQGCHIGASVLGNAFAPLHGQGPGQATVLTGYVSFVSAQIEGSLFLNGAEFAALPEPPLPGRKPTSASFGSARDQIGLDLFHSKIGGSLSLVDASSTIGRQVDLRNCNVDTLSPGNTMWHEGWYDIVGLTYRNIAASVKTGTTRDKDRTVTDTGRTRRRWIKESVSAKKPGPYLTLAAAARSHGEPSDELKAKIRASSVAARWWEKGLWGWVRYGYRPYMVIVPIMFLGLVAYFQVNQTRSDPSGFTPVVVGNNSYTVKTCDEAKLNCLDPALYAIDSVFPVDQHQVSTWRPNRGSDDGALLDWVVTINRLAAWLLTGVFVASVAGVLKRT